MHTITATAAAANEACFVTAAPAEDTAPAQTFEQQCAALRAANPKLKVGKYRDTAAVNIRTMLKAAFPGVRFSVTQSTGSMTDQINVRWEDGPTEAAVKEVIGCFKAGSFDGMTECYEYSRSAWTETFGAVCYLSTGRSVSDALLQRAIDAVATKYRATPPSVQDYRTGRTWNTSPLTGMDGDLHWSWQGLINEHLRLTAGE